MALAKCSVMILDHELFAVLMGKCAITDIVGHVALLSDIRILPGTVTCVCVSVYGFSECA